MPKRFSLRSQSANRVHQVSKGHQGEEENQAQRRNNKECNTDTESFLYHRFPLIGGVGMRGGEDKIQMNEV